jgi:hypothetical protein
MCNGEHQLEKDLIQILETSLKTAKDAATAQQQAKKRRAKKQRRSRGV